MHGQKGCVTALAMPLKGKEGRRSDHNIHPMASIRHFDDLPDLVFIDLFGYLSPMDVLWTFATFNTRLRALVTERGFFRHINLSSDTARRSKFDSVIELLPLDEIETLTINVEASSLQLSRWPFLPRLRALRLHGLRQFDDAANFILRHSTSLTDLTLRTNDDFLSVRIYHSMTETETIVVSTSKNCSMLRSFFQEIVLISLDGLHRKPLASRRSSSETCGEGSAPLELASFVGSGSRYWNGSAVLAHEYDTKPSELSSSAFTKYDAFV